ncbi:N-terminal kinase-like protein [Strongyloides ratti]|uniref:N-terminal kinase-like protein n=1 Tax=Strongyloides ratti TaxID=34506 RepID=A0A090LJU0_STRRB|nr:N-terminal kinase-like protein [Strongyloides ratti]CEF70077.1 N-terminal kinase-like protein [Strongyloides ratti]
MLSSLFSRDPKSSFPWDLSLKSYCSNNGLQISNTFKKSDNLQKGTCFFTSQINGDELKTQIQKLKTLKHPNILSYFDSLETNDTIYLITEECKPLHQYINDSNLKGIHLEMFTSWGMYQILNLLKFLHNDVKINHGSIRRNIYVTPSGDWKLAGFEASQSFSSSKNDLSQFCIILWEIFNGFNDGMLNPKAPGKMPEKLHNVYKKMASSKTSAQEILNESAFFNGLIDNLDLFPGEIAKHKILPRLILCYEFGDAGVHILSPLFKIGTLLDETEYQKMIVPCIAKLFTSNDRSIRVRLLEKIEEFAPHMQSNDINEKIYINITNGFNDPSPAIREMTVKAIVHFADKLNYNNLNVDLMKYLARIQGTDENPGARTNSTICLGKIACYIDPSHRQKILLSAFTRALKDPFPPNRIAGILAMSATQQFYSLSEVANRILPALGPATFDSEKQVRDQAFKSLKGFIDKLEKVSENPDLLEEMESQVKAGGKGGMLSGEKLPAWAGWAFKSLSEKLYKGSPQPGNQLSKPTEIKKESKTINVSDKFENTVQQKNELSDDWEDAKDNDITNTTPKDDTSSTNGWDCDDDILEDIDDIKPINIKKTNPIPTKKLPMNEDDFFSDAFERQTKKVGTKSTALKLGSKKNIISTKKSTIDDEINSIFELDNMKMSSSNNLSDSLESKEALKEKRRLEIAARNEKKKAELAAKRAAKLSSNTDN